MNSNKRKYWKPEPKAPIIDILFHALLWPAIFYSIGVILYGSQALIPRDSGGEMTLLHKIGSMIMVCGGEISTLPTAIEVFRKHQEKRAKIGDWAALVVSLIATLGNLFIVYTAYSQAIDEPWVDWVRNYGPLILLLFSGLDFYANTLELGYYLATFGERWEGWNNARHTYETRGTTKEKEHGQDSEEKTKEPISKTANVDDWREIAANLDGKAANVSASFVANTLALAGFSLPHKRTLQMWAKRTREGTLLQVLQDRQGDIL